MPPNTPLQTQRMAACPTPPLMLEKNKAIARWYIEELWNKKNLAVIDEVFVSHFEGHLVNPSKGHQGIKENVGAFLRAFPNGHATIDDLFGEGDRICFRWRFEAKHEGPFLHIPPTGKDVVVKGITIERFEGDKIAEIWAEIDVFGLLKQLGVM